MESIAPPSTRELRGIKLFKEHGNEIKHTGHGVYEVPGCSGGTYTVDLAVFGGEESCSCPDFQRNQQPCKHVYAGALYRAKSRAKARKEQAERTASRASGSSLASLAAAL